MIFFDFHHHKSHNSYGIYNLHQEEILPENYFSVGIHPKDIDGNWQENLEKVKEISQQQNCVAIGECGLDALINIDENLQKKIFEAQILWANEINKPMIIHCVKRFQELIPFQKLAKVPLIIHGFNKKKAIADEMLKHGFYLSFGKSVLHSVSLQAIVKDFPLEKMFLETDDADFDIAELYQKVAELKEISLGKLQKQISNNLEILNIKF
jgi:TatD DNase family protein